MLLTHIAKKQQQQQQQQQQRKQAYARAFIKMVSKTIYTFLKTLAFTKYRKLTV